MNGEDSTFTHSVCLTDCEQWKLPSGSGPNEVERKSEKRKQRRSPRSELGHGTEGIPNARLKCCISLSRQIIDSGQLVVVVATAAVRKRLAAAGSLE